MIDQNMIIIYDNYIYKNTNVKQVPKFDEYNIITILNKIYKYIIKYSNPLLSSKPDRLLIANQIKNLKTAIEQILVYEIVLNNII